MPARAATPPHRMLIVDDEPPIVFALGEYFSAQGFVVDSAGDLDEARRLLERHRYALVITDLRLSGSGGTEGFELVTLLREQFPRVRIVLLTGYGSPEIEREAHQRGADVFLQKPIPLDALATIADRLVAEKVLP
jgi:DNA-binding response OmpR family regulator